MSIVVGVWRKDYAGGEDPFARVLAALVLNGRVHRVMADDLPLRIHA